MNMKFIQWAETRPEIVLLAVLFFLLPFQGIFIFDAKWLYPLKYALILLLWLLVSFRILLRHAPVPGFLGWFLALPLLYGVASIPSLVFNATDFRGYCEVASTLLAMSMAGLIIVSASNWHEKERAIRWMIFALVMGIAISIFLSVVHYLTDIDWFLPVSHLHFLGPSRLNGTFKSPIVLSIFAFVGALLLVLAFQKYWIDQKVFLVLECLCFFGVFASVTKATIIAGGMVLFLLFIAMRRFPFVRKRMWTLIVLSIILGGVAAMGAITWKFSSQSLSASLTPAEVLRMHPDIMSTGQRLILWKAGISTIERDWLMGIGSPNWPKVLSEYKETSPHNGLLEVWGGLGIAGLLLYLSVPVALFLSVKNNWVNNIFSLISMAVLVFYLVREQFDVSDIYSFTINGLLFWSLIGLMFVGSTIVDSGQDAPSEDSTLRSTKS